MELCPARVLPQRAHPPYLFFLFLFLLAKLPPIPFLRVPRFKFRRLMNFLLGKRTPLPTRTITKVNMG